VERKKRREGRDKKGEGDVVGVWEGEEPGMPEGDRENVDSRLLEGEGGGRGGGQYKRDATRTHVHSHVSNTHRQNTKTRAHVDIFDRSSILLSEFNKSPLLCSFGQI